MQMVRKKDQEMAGNKDSKGGGSRHTIKNPDSLTRKCFPNGLRSLIRSIHQSWPEDVLQEGKPKAWDTFLRSFTPYFLNVEKIYGLVPPETKIDKEPDKETIEKVHATLKPLETNSLKDRREITFSDMRSFSEYVGGLPTGLFLLYSQCVSENGQDFGDAEQVAFLNNCIASLQDLKSFVEKNRQKNPGKEPFVKWTDRTAGIYDARLLSLKILVDAWNSGVIRFGLKKRRTIEI
jgi:hypothetical protein